MHRNFLQVMHHDAADNPGDQRTKEARAKAVTNPGTDSAWSQRRTFCNGITDVSGEERHHQRQTCNADIKQFFQIRIGYGIRHCTFAIQHDGNRQQNTARYHEGNHV